MMAIQGIITAMAAFSGNSAVHSDRECGSALEATDSVVPSRRDVRRNDRARIEINERRNR
jgi:hypothetical protein